MTEKQISLYEQWSSVYDSDEEFARMCDEHIAKLENPQQEKLKSILQQICGCLEDYLTPLQLSQIHLFLDKIVHHPYSARWFTPRYYKEKINVHTVCRLVFYMVENYYICDVRIEGKRLNLKVLSQLIYDSEVVDHCIAPNSIRTYLSSPSPFLSFEKLCNE